MKMKTKTAASRAGKLRDDALLAWHLLHRGVYARVARKLRIDASYVSRVAAGDRESPRIRKALVSELERIHRLRPAT
jgi:hypothetical protein